MTSKKGDLITNGIDTDESFDHTLIDKSVKFINEKANETLYKGSLEIGEYILKNFFNDDVELASSKNPRKPKSYKALCEHKDLAIPYSTLTIMVRVAAQERLFKANNIDTDKLSYTHRAELIRINDEEKKIDITKQCIDEALSSRELSKLVSLSRKEIMEIKKCSQEETAFKNILRIEQLLNRTEKSELITDIKKLKGMRKKTREDLRLKTAELLEKTLKTARECKTLLKNLEKVQKKEN